MKLFQEHGQVLTTKIETYEDGTSRGFGFVQFDKKEPADAAIAALNGKDVASKQLVVQKFIKNEERDTEDNFNNLFVRGLPEGTDDAKLTAMFAPFGAILSAIVAKDKTNGTPHQYGYVTYTENESAKKAIEALNMKINETGKEVLFVQKFLKKKEMEHQKSQKNSYLKQQNAYNNRQTLVVKGKL